MGNMRTPETVVKNDKLVWVKGANGVCVPKWLSVIQHRVDLEILCDYKDGDQCPNDPNNKPAKPKRKATVAKVKEEVEE